MAQSGYTPIQLYRTTTASAAPTAGNLADGELAINTADGKLFYKDSGGAVQTLASKATGTVGGSNTQVQFNSSGALAGSANLTFDGSNLQIGSQGDLRLGDSDNSNWLALQAPATVTSNVTWTLPATDGSNGQVLSTNGSGTLAWTTPAAGGLTANDVGTAPNQIPLNQMLGSMAFQDANGVSVGSLYSLNGVTIANPSGNVGLTIGRQGDAIYYNSISIWSGYNGSYATHTQGQDYIGAYYQSGASFRFVFPTGGGGVSLAYNGTSWTSLSDERLKNIKSPIDNACAAVDALKAFKFSWKYDTENKTKVGVSAQTVAAVLPEATAPMNNPVDKDDKTEYIGVNYTELVPLLVAAIQELNAEIRKLKGL